MPAEPQELFKPGDDLSFGDAFKLARDFTGAGEFSWRGDTYTTRREGDPAESSFDFIETLRRATALPPYSESTFRRVPWANRLEAIMKEELTSGAERYGGRYEPEADRWRHVSGMRRAALDPGVGGVRAWLGGLGHEMTNLKKGLWDRDMRSQGSPSDRLGIKQVLGNSWTDLLNNTVGVASAYTDPNADTESIAERGYLPPSLESPSAYNDEDVPGMWMGGPVHRPKYL